MHEKQEPNLKSEKLARSRMLRFIWLTVAVISFAIACVGLVLPLLPSTEFLILSAWAAARGSTRFHGWLLNHRVFGKLLRNWQNGGRVSRKAKWSATIAMSICSVVMIITISHKLSVIAAITCMIGVQIWLWCRPEPVSAEMVGLKGSEQSLAEINKGEDNQS